MKKILPWLHWILIASGVALLLLHLVFHMTSNVPLVTALLLEISGIVVFVAKMRRV